MNELTIREKAAILLRNGLIQWEDRANHDRVERRWFIYKNTAQKTSHILRQKPRVRSE